MGKRLECITREVLLLVKWIAALKTIFLNVCNIYDTALKSQKQSMEIPRNFHQPVFPNGWFYTFRVAKPISKKVISPNESVEDDIND